MGKIALIAAALFVVAMLVPELRPMLVVGAFCWVAGFMVGAQYSRFDGCRGCM